MIERYWPINWNAETHISFYCLCFFYANMLAFWNILFISLVLAANDSSVHILTFSGASTVWFPYFWIPEIIYIPLFGTFRLSASVKSVTFPLQIYSSNVSLIIPVHSVIMSFLDIWPALVCNKYANFDNSSSNIYCW